jgi:hypothetical protein
MNAAFFCQNSDKFFIQLVCSKIKFGSYEFKKVIDFFDGYIFIVMLVEIYISTVRTKSRVVF